ncbi:MAG: hypothetical protein H6765_07610 [Candidatus Peribacteria bacterium]|nr:MAG: hypothetical protein H6765_07610 [Candidatus Peribacteria bacterium]
MASLKKELITLKSDLADSKTYVNNYAKFLYQVQNDYYTSESLSSIKLFVRSDNIAESMSSEDLVEMLLQRLKLLMVRIQEKQLAYLTYSRELNEEKVSYEADVVSYQNSIKSLEEQKQNLYKLLAYIQGDLEKSTQQVEDLFSSKQELEQQMTALQKLADPDTQAILDENSGVFTLLNETDRSDGQKYFSWPVFPVEYIGYYYHDTNYLESYGKQFQGLRLEIPQ